VFDRFDPFAGLISGSRAFFAGVEGERDRPLRFMPLDRGCSETTRAQNEPARTAAGKSSMYKKTIAPIVYVIPSSFHSGEQQSNP
jgi:hypothetical protein